MTAKHQNCSKRLIKCPGCGGMVIYDMTNPYRPFCSERCKTTDLAAWASEQYRIPAESNDAPLNHQDKESEDEED